MPNTIISSFAIISLVLIPALFHRVWAHTAFAGILFRIISRIIKHVPAPPDSCVSHEDFRAWALSTWPFPQNYFGYFLSCPICHLAWVSVACGLSAAILTITGSVFESSNLTLGVALQIGFSVVVIGCALAYHKMRGPKLEPATLHPDPWLAQTPQPSGCSHRLTHWRGLTPQEKQAVKEQASTEWNALLGLQQVVTINEDGTKSSVIGLKQAGSMLPTIATRVFMPSATVDYPGIAELRADYFRDIEAFTKSGECGTCAPEAHVQHLYYREVSAILRTNNVV